MEVYIVNGCRSAIGTFCGSLSQTSLADLGAVVVKEALKRSEIDPHTVDEVIMGAVLTAGQGQNIARQILVHSGIPVDVPAFTLNMVCGSGLKTIIEGAQHILLGEAEIVVAGGVENMSTAPHLSNTMRKGTKMGQVHFRDSLLTDGLEDAFEGYHMGITAENICEEYKLTREELDDYALESQKKATKAQEDGKFQEEIVPVSVKVKGKTVDFDQDEFIKTNCTLEALEKLRPVFHLEGRVTAGNSSGINDGAAAVVLASGDAVKKYNLKPMAKLISWGQSGIEPSMMGLGPVKASKSALDKVNLTVEDLDLIESSEAFAAQSIAVARELSFDEKKVNVNGGAIALGHPIGASGCRIMVTLLHELRRREGKHGLATLCIGGGMGISAVVERV